LLDNNILAVSALELPNEVVLSSKASAMLLASNYRADECRRSVDFSTVTSQVSYVAEVFDFATGDWTLVWSSVLIRVFS